MAILKFYSHDISEWDDIEIHPIKDGAIMDDFDGRNAAADEQPDYWCLFLHLDEGGMQELADVSTLQDAQQLETALKQLARQHIWHFLRQEKPSPEQFHSSRRILAPADYIKELQLDPIAQASRIAATEIFIVYPTGNYIEWLKEGTFKLMFDNNQYFDNSPEALEKKLYQLLYGN